MKRLLIILLFFYSAAMAQTPKADSLLQVIQTDIEDSLKQEARLQYVIEVRHNPDLAWPVINEAISQAKESHDYYFLHKFYNASGVVYWQIGNSDSSIMAFEKSLYYAVYSKDKLGIATASLGLSNNYKNTGDFEKSIKYALDAETNFKLAEDHTGVARTCNVLGIIFRIQKDYPKSIHYYNKGLSGVRALNDSVLEAGFLSNIGVVYQEMQNYDSAWHYHNLALKFRINQNDTKGMAISYGNIGSIYMEEGQLDSALFYTEMALEKFTAVSYSLGIMEAYGALGNIWQKKSNHVKALSMLKAAEKYATEGNFLPNLIDISKSISTSLIALGNHKEATRYLLQYIDLKDSLFNEEQSKEVQKLEIEFEYEQKKLADSLQNLEREKIAILQNEKQKQANEAQAARFKTYMLGGIAVLVLIFVVVLLQYRSNKKQKKYNHIIALQKATVEEKNKEITDSITYAKRIQEAILPPAHLVEKHLPQSFILYKPKDIVAGDFYWFEYTNDQILIAAADCTGHGVPGAMVSVVCSNALNRSVKEFGIKTPSKILDKVRELVIETFEKSEKDVKDGMDIALVSIKAEKNSDVKYLEYSGANNPLWIFRSDAAQVEELKADKQPIGNYIDQKQFTNHAVQLKSGDAVYFFTDGYQDQFGGTKGKKFKTSNLIQLIASIQSKSMREQKTILNDSFELWRSNLEQVDDVCIIGIRL